MCGGAFEGIDDLIERRVFKDKQTIGFKSSALTSDGPYVDDDVIQFVNADDLLDYGFIPEFIGRLPVVVSLSHLNKQALIKVLTQPKNAFVKQYQCLFDMDGVDLRFTEDALERAAELALDRKTGARGLRSILEHTLLEVMYELPSMNNIHECIINGDSIGGKEQPLLLDNEGNTIAIRSREPKSA
jgi:ATP-dependent Clp protease ATP-binding subunit ClpX